MEVFFGIIYGRVVCHGAQKFGSKRWRGRGPTVSICPPLASNSPFLLVSAAVHEQFAGVFLSCRRNRQNPRGSCKGIPGNLMGQQPSSYNAKVTILENTLQLGTLSCLGTWVVDPIPPSCINTIPRFWFVSNELDSAYWRHGDTSDII